MKNVFYWLILKSQFIQQ